MADDGFDALSTFEPAFLRSGQVLQATMQNVEAFDFASAKAQIDDDVPGFHLRENRNLLDLLGQRVAVVGITGEAACSDEQALLGGDSQADFDAELVRIACLPLPMHLTSGACSA